MKIAVTGANGFIGRYLLDALSEDRLIECLALTRGEAPAKYNIKCKWATTDYSKESLYDLLKSVDIVIHLAGTKGDKTNLSEFDADFGMTSNLLDAMAYNKVRRIIYASSRIVYGDPRTVPWKEYYQPAPRIAYGINKVRCENLCLEYSKNYGIETVIVRIAQVLGKGEGTKTMVNIFQDLAREGKELTVQGKSIARRQYIYAGDLAEVLCLLATRSNIGTRTVNVGMTEAYTNYEIAKMMNAAYGNDAVICYDDSKPETITDSYMSTDVLTQEIGFVPMDMEAALAIMAK